MIYVVARMEIKEGCMPAMKALLAKTVPIVRAENGCISYTPCVDVEGDVEKYITFVESWESQEALKAHLASAHMAEFRTVANTLRFNSEVKVLSPAEL